MATYYRWRKSTVNYIASVDDSYTTNNLAIPNLDNKIYFCNNEPNIDENGKFITTSSREVSSETQVSFNTNQWVSNLENPTEMYSSNVSYKATVSGNNIFLADFYDLPGAIFKKTVVNANIGTFVEYVYSTSSSAYPNGGVSGGYYYDQRTTVTSPTTPGDVTVPSPITSPTFTVSWTAATSNTNYPVKQYLVQVEMNATPHPILSQKTVTGTSTEITIPTTYNGAPVTSVNVSVLAQDTNNQNGPGSKVTSIPVYLAPTLTVPQMVMQGQSATISWSAIEGPDSYTLQRKSSADADWTQVYSGANLSYSETVGTWTSLQYRVQAVFDGTAGGWATSDPIQIVSASALVISGQDGDLGTLVNDVPYSISSDQTSPTIDVTVEVNGGEYAAFQATSGQTYTIGVLDLPTGTGSIVLGSRPV